MKQPPVPQELEPFPAASRLALPTRPRPIRPGVRLHIRGRSVHLRGLRRTPTGFLRWVLMFGPGLIATSAGNDAGGIATYSAAGARYGYALIWVMLIANGGLVVSEFVGIGAAMELLGISKYVAIPLGAALLWYLVIFGSYVHVEKVFLGMTLVFLAYPAAAIMAQPHWADVARGALWPTVHREADYIVLLVGLLGTTITPYMQLFQQSSLVEKGVARRHYGPERIDTYVGATFSNLMSICMIIATAATLHVVGHTDITTAADAARALEPVVGRAAGGLFAVGLLGASLLAGAVLPLATAYAVSEAFGIPKGINLDLRRARFFFRLFTLLILFGAGWALLPNVPVIQLLVGMQVLNGVLLPIILVFILRLINDERLTGALKNTRLYNILGWGTWALITTAVVLMLGSQCLEMFGRSPTR